MSISSSMGAIGLGLLLASTAACAADRPERPSREKMEAVRACAKKGGVDLPSPKGPPPARGEEGEGDAPKGPPPSDGADRKGPPPGPKLTDVQKNVVDACFKENGVEPPPAHGKGGHPGGPPPEGGKAE